MSSRKANPLSLTMNKNYCFVASFDKISSNNENIYLLNFLNFLGISKSPKQICMISTKVDLLRKNYDVLLNTGLI